ncbi:hypothetical protein PybrP1_003515 [[Pythium] brassicae (nom. inval.)]|nr:hypothetical protein PybrP1_003515 [[Pythium] brassicae (nom. inval.)]
MDAMDAVALGARVQQVAEKLQLKAQEAREKGNGGAAQALADSASDLRQAAAVLVEQKRLLTVRQSPASAASDAPPGSSSGGAAQRLRLRRNSSASSLVSMQSAFDAASVAGSVHAHAHAQQPPHAELLSRLTRVEKMLAKKSDEMRSKGNENAGGALQQSAAFVRAGSALISEQQQHLQALASSFERLQSQWRALGTALALSDDDRGDDAVLARVTALQRERDASAETTQALEAERDALRKQVADAKKEHAEEYLILREDLAILQNDKRDLERAVRDVERECTERSERELAALQAALNTATRARDELACTAAATATQARELQQQAEAWKEKYHDEQRKLSEFLAAAQTQHSSRVASLESELKALATATATAASESELVAGGQELARLQDEQAALQALLSECETSLESELARSTQLLHEREALRTRVADMEQQHASAVAALASEHDRHASALERACAVQEDETQALAARLADAQRECNARERIIGELTQAVDGYRDECSKARRELKELESAHATQRGVAAGTTQQLTALRELSSAFLRDTEELLAAPLPSGSEDVTSERFGRVKALVTTALAEKTAAAAQVQDALAQLAAARAASADASAQETAELQRRLDDTAREFERYRARSHAALKKVEKRAELLNGMRKETEQLRQQLAGSEDALRCAEQRAQQLADMLREATQTQRMLQEELAQRAAETRDALAAAEATRQQLGAKNARATRELEDATARLLAAEQEKAALVAASEQLRAQEATEREAERAGLELQRHASDTQLAALTDEVETLRAQIAGRETQRRTDEQRIASLEQQVDELESRLRDAPAAEAASASKEQTIRALRVQVLELQEQLQAVEDATAARALAAERDELAQVQAARVALQKASEHAISAKQRHALVQAFQQRLHAVVDELQRGLDDHAAAFRDACAFRDAFKQQAALAGEPQDSLSTGAEPENDDALFEECRAVKSGVVVKAGAGFALPVVCEAAGWRVTWSFAVKEATADVGFTLVLADRAQRRDAVVVVAPQRVNALSGTFTVAAADVGATLRFEWDNAFSWLNEKTLDYHVSVQAPLSPAKSQLRVQTRSLQRTATELRDGLARLGAEAAARAQLQAAVAHLHAAEQDKDAYAGQFDAQLRAVAARKSALQQQMEGLKAALSRALAEQDELGDVGATLTRAWSGAAAERDDAETTVQLAEASQLESLAQQLEARVQELEQALLACQDEELSPLVAAA